LISTNSLTNSTLFGGTTNSVQIDTTYGIKLNGTATVYDDLMFPFSTGKSGTADYPPFDADSNYYTFTVDTTPAGVCIMYFQIQLPHSWKEGSTIYPHVHYKQIGANIPQFRVKYRWMGIGETDKTFKWCILNNSTGTSNNTHQMMYSNDGISGTNKTISSILLCQVYLYTPASGQADCKAYQFDIHIEKDGLGSKKETAK
jgi:hypothetical protein